MIYRHLRELEENGWVVSQWETEGAGPAKRVYQITPEGLDVLSYWIDHMNSQAEKLLKFIASFQNASQKEN